MNKIQNNLPLQKAGRQSNNNLSLRETKRRSSPHKYLVLAVIIGLLFLLPLYGQGRERGNTALLQAENLLGLTPAEVIAQLGAPGFVYPLRGSAHWQDNVIFYYDSNHLYLFFFDNRVWQVRYDHRSRDMLIGITPGMAKTTVREILGTPYYSGDNEDIFLNPAGITRPRRGFPIRLRLIYDQNNNLYDIYLYRGDF
ncbi:MAG: hypothetical protein FWD87_07800 [Spirochaetaceae bacterium]|nr:hypothetical protein [Spirochaetaceae bacterium]